jgi:ABC-type glycerol-3-phosphate transport system permease component
MTRLPSSLAMSEAAEEARAADRAPRAARERQARPDRQAIGIRLARLGRELGMILAGCAILFPIYWMINLSFQTAEQIFSLTPVWFPTTPVLTWYERVFRVANFHRPLINSLVVSISSTVCVLVLDVLAAYPLARLRFPFRRVVYVLIIGTMMIPEQVQMIPRYLMTLRLHWINTYHGIFIPYLGGAFGVFLLTQFLQSIPRELEEAARIDGASYLQVLWHVIVPLMKGPLITLGVLEFLSNWNAFLWPLIAINSDEMRTVAVEMFFLEGKTSGSAELGMVLVGAVLSALPVIILYLVFQRRIVGSLGHLRMKG